MKKIKYILVVFVLSLTVLSGCSLPGLGSKSTKNDVKITALSTSESQIISHMLRLLI
ncbi:osmoprotectant ABC transporter substrate-binding protein, partial [Staphylococcus aureus]|nr:osmoprotectant ABC transporter substrate-binding protein [Staphylococcus aureus]